MRKNGVMNLVKCKNCGKVGLAWRETLSGYKLCDFLGEHLCPNLKSKKNQANK